MKQTVTTTDDGVVIYEARDLSSRVVTHVPKGSDIQLGTVDVVEGREWMEAAFEDSNTGYVLGPTARGHTTLGSKPSRTNSAATPQTHEGQLAGVVGDAPPMERSGNKSFEKPWICVKCNVAVESPITSENKRRTCELGHKVEKPIGFLGGLIGPASFWVMGAALSHVVGWIWSMPARWIIAFTLFGVGVLPWVGLVRGVVNIARGGMARRLASGYLGMMLGSVVMVFIIGVFAAEGAIQLGASRCTNPDQPYRTDSRAERVYRFFLPYGLDVAEQHCVK